MNSLQDLNAYSAASTIEFTDNRPSNVLFDLTTTPTPAAVNIYEGENHSVPNPINITDIVNYQACTTTYNINISSLPAGTVVEWPTYPGYMTASDADGIYSITGFKTPSDWTTVKNPVVNIPNDISGTYVYPVSIVYFNGTVETTRTWNVTLNITAVDEMSETTLFDYTTSTTATILGTPTIIDADVAKTYTLTITPSKTTTISTMSSSGTGGTSSFNGTTKVLTLVGTKTQVNSHLETISYTSTSVQEDFTLTYLLTNNLNAITDTKYQTLRCFDILYFGNVRTPSIYYNEDTVKIVQGGPLVTDSSADGTGTYTVTVTPSTTAAVSTMSATAASLAKTITNTGSVKVKTAQSKFGGASANFTGLANGLITVENSPAFNFSNNDFTVEFWVRPTGGYPAGGIMNKVGSSVWGPHLGWTISMQNYAVEFWQGFASPSNYSPLVAVSKIGSTGVIATDSWTHIAFTCQNGTFRTFKNGVLQQTTNNIGQIADSSSYLQIGKGYYGDDGTGNNGGQWRDTWSYQIGGDPAQDTNGMFNGYLDEIRISKIARYTSTFTPATSAFTGDNYNSLLIHANGANDSTAFTDDTSGQTLSGTSSFNNSTKVLTLSGNRDAVNNLIDLISLTPATDYRQNFSLSYRVTTPESNVAVKVQQALIGVADTDITNMNITRGYIGNNPNYLFSTSTPVIGDTDPTAATFTVSLSCSSALGSWSTQRNVNVSGATSISYTGTKAACNAWFSTVIFYPKKDSIASGNVTYTQIKNGSQQVSLQFSIIGTSQAYPDEGYLAGPNTTGAFTWTPTAEQAYYVGVIQLLLVGGGGGGGLGGGGGGGVRLYNNIPITAGTTYSGYVGLGGNPSNYDFVTSNYSTSTSGGASSFNGYSATGGGPGVRGAGAGGGYDASATGNGGTSASTTGTSRSGGTGYNSSTQRRGGGGASPMAAGTSASTNPNLGADRFGGAGAAAYTFEGLNYSAGGTGGFYDRVNNQAVSGSAGSGTAGCGGAGNIGGAAIGGSSGTLKTGLPLATGGQNGRVKIWVRRV